jgi:hypothetical protein
MEAFKYALQQHTMEQRILTGDRKLRSTIFTIVFLTLRAVSLSQQPGKEAVDLFTDRRMKMDDCVSKRLTLNKGRNVIRGAVINGPGMSDFCLRFIDENGGPIKDLTITLDSAGK